MTSTPIYEDSYVLTRIREGDEFFFNLIFQKYRNRLFTYLYKITKSKEAAEETVVDVFLKLWNGRELVTEIRDLERFLFTIAHNKAIDFLRAAKRNPVVLQQVWDVFQNQPDDNLDKRLLQENIAAAVRTGAKHLSPQRYKVFYLRYNENMSYEEIARRMNISSNTVRNHLAASLQLIREHIQKEDFFLFAVLLCLEKNL